MYRTWSLDADYLVESNWTIPILNKSQPLQFKNGTPAYTAPEEVYTTSRMMGNDASLNLRSNMTWKFSVDAGFHYLIRLHFCELLAEVTGPDQHVFDIFINNQTVETNIDVFSMSGGIGFPMYRDYRVDNRTQGRDLWLALHPQPGGLVDAFLNGLELFKLNQSDGNLAGPNPDSISSPAPPDSQGPKSKVTSIILPIIGAILGGFALVSLLVSFFVFQRQRKLKDSLSFTSKFFTTKSSSSLPSDICCHFSIAEVKSATQDFDDALLIGSGGFGNVYRGIMKGGTTIAAIKRLNPSSRQGAHEFHTEITMLSKLRHKHLVSLIGYCDDHGEMILVYDYMARGTLRCGTPYATGIPLRWTRRLHGRHGKFTDENFALNQIWRNCTLAFKVPDSSLDPHLFSSLHLRLLCFKMNLLSLTAFLISLLQVVLPSTTAAPYNATDIIVLNCGASSTTTSLAANGKLIFSLNIPLSKTKTHRFLRTSPANTPLFRWFPTSLDVLFLRS
ncbi:hypothetical protein SLEP1_g27490 [Rubroshorea leprosula]|uniref:Protein kinase domain-containing protein n=1 Tax=Rubroshorea leprosula TaxID=152421 RepID=A0AAV5JZA4_9ROSI|nr:hypothetical protein SLEP1_g27490 [Rubroshorea leprosula]